MPHLSLVPMDAVSVPKTETLPTASRSEGWLTAILNEALRRVPGTMMMVCLDLAQGAVIEFAARERIEKTSLNMLAASIWELFDSNSLLALDKLWRTVEPIASPAEATRKLIVVSGNSIHIILRSQKFPVVAVAAVCRSEVKMGLALAHCQDALHEIEEQY